MKGARVGEAVMMQRKDVDYARKKMAIAKPSKGSNSRIVRVSEKCLAMVKNMSIKYGASFNVGGCSGNYTSTVTSSASLPITNNAVGPTTVSLSNGGSLTFAGTFTDSTHVTVNVSWQQFITGCNFLHAGSRTYTASR